MIVIKNIRKCVLLAISCMVVLSNLWPMISTNESICNKKSFVFNAQNLILDQTLFERKEECSSTLDKNSSEEIVFPVSFLNNNTKVFIEYPYMAKIIGKDGNVIRTINLNVNNNKDEDARLLGYVVIKKFNLIVASLGCPRHALNKKDINNKKECFNSFFIFDAVTGTCIKECKEHTCPVFSFITRDEGEESYLIAFSPNDQKASIWNIKEGKNGIKITCVKNLFECCNRENDYFFSNVKSCRQSIQSLMNNQIPFIADFKEDINGENQPENAEWTHQVQWISEDTFLKKPFKIRIFKNKEDNVIAQQNRDPISISKKSKKIIVPECFSSCVYFDSCNETIFLASGNSVVCYKLADVEILSGNQVTNKNMKEVRDKARKIIFTDSSKIKDEFCVLEKLQGFNILVVGSVQGWLRFIDLSTNKVIKAFNFNDNINEGETAGSVESFDSSIDEFGFVSMIIGLSNGKKSIWNVSSKNIKSFFNGMKARVSASIKNNGSIERYKTPDSDITINFMD